jgi:hypothetical protein
MADTSRFPNLRALVDPLLGASYESWNCWHLCRHLLHEGFGLNLDADPEQAQSLIAEIWYRGDTRNPLTLLQPWDCFILAAQSPVSDSVGLVVDPQYFVHTAPQTGVCLERTRRWRPKLLQLARLRSLF